MCSAIRSSSVTPSSRTSLRNEVSACWFSQASSSDREATEIGPSISAGGRLTKIDEDVRLPEQGLALLGQFHRKQPFMDDLSLAINHAGVVEVETCR